MAEILVGKVAVRVYPDTSDWRKEAKAELKSEANGLEVSVPVVPDVERLRTELPAAIKSLNAALKANKNLHIKVPVDLDTAGLSNDLRLALAELKTKAATDPVNVETKVDKAKFVGLFDGLPNPPDLKVGIQLESATFEAKVAAALAKAKLVTSPPLTVKVTVDDNMVTYTLKDLRRKFATAFSGFTISPRYTFDRSSEALVQYTKSLRNRIIGGIGDIKVDVKTKLDEFSALSAKEKASVILNRIKVGIEFSKSFAVKALAAKREIDAIIGNVKSKIKVALDSKSVLRAKAAIEGIKVFINPEISSSSAAKINQWFQRLSGFRLVKSQINEAVDAFKSLDKMIPKLLAMTPAVGVAVAGLISASGAVLSLGRDVAKALPIVLAIPTVFLGVATSALAFGVAIKDINNRMPELKSQFAQIKTVIRDNFWREALVPMREAARVLIPEISAGMKAVASSSGAWFGDLLTTFKNTLPGPLKTFLAATSAMNVNLKAMNQPLADIFKVFFNMSQWLLPSFATGLSNLTKKFSEWLNKANESGKLQGWIEGAVQKFKDFWTLIISIYEWLNALTRPLETLNKMTIDSLADSFKRGAAAMNTAMGQINIGLIFQSAEAAMHGFWANASSGAREFFGNLPGFLQQVLPTLGKTGGTLASAILGGLSDAFPGIQTFVDKVAEAINTLAPKIRTAIGQLGTTLGVDLGNMISGFTPLLEMILDIFNSVIGKLGSTISHLSHGLTELLKPLMPGIKEIIDYAGTAINEVAIILDDLMTQMAPYLPEIMNQLIPLLKEAFDGIVPVLRDLAQQIIILMPIIGPLLASLLFLARMLLAVILPVIEVSIKQSILFMTTIGRMADAIGQSFEKMSRGDFIGAFTTLKDGMTSAMKDFDTENTKLSKSIGQRVVDNLSGVFATKSTSAITEVGDKVRGEFGAIERSAITMDHEVVARTGSVARRFSDMQASVAVAVQDTQTHASEGWDVVGKNITSPFDVVLGKVGDTFSSIAGRVQQGVASVVSYANAAWSMLVVVTSIGFSAFGAQVTAGVNSAMAVVATIPGRASSAVGGLGSVLFAAGVNLIAGFIRGIQSMISVVRSVLLSLTASLPSWKGPIEKDRVLFKPIGKTIMQSLIDGFKVGGKDVKSYLLGFTNDISQMSLGNVSANISEVNQSAASNGSPTPGGVNVYQNIYNPVLRSADREVNRGLQLATI